MPVNHSLAPVLVSMPLRVICMVHHLVCLLGGSHDPSQTKLRTKLPPARGVLHFTSPDETVGTDVVEPPTDRPPLILPHQDERICLPLSSKGIGHTGDGIDRHDAPQVSVAIAPSDGGAVANACGGGFHDAGPAPAA